MLHSNPLLLLRCPLFVALPHSQKEHRFHTYGISNKISLGLSMAKSTICIQK